MAKPKIRAKEIMADIKAGMDDAWLMEKYGLSPKGIITLMSRLIWEGLMTPEELEARRSLAKTVYMPVYQCPSCGDIQYTKTEKCPRCGTRLKNVNEKKPDRE